MKVPYLDLQAVTNSFEPELTEAMTHVLRSGWYLNGEANRLFEADFAAYCGAKHCVGVGNGLDALSLILQALKEMEGWDNGDEVILPALTFVATARAVDRAGLTPVFCDVSAEDYLLNPALIPQSITKRTRALLPVHLYGKICDMEALGSLARQYGLKVIEDAAQAHGATFGQKRAGAWGIAAAYSFYPGKNLGALGDGGAVVTSDEALANHVRTLANYGAAHKYHHDYAGINSRLDEIQAAVLRIKLSRLEKDNRRRMQIARIYSENIQPKGVRLPYCGECGSSVFHIYPLLAERREALASFLRAEGVETLIHYPLPLHRQKVYRTYGHCGFPVAEYVAAHEISLPISQVMTDEQAHYVAERTNAFLREM